MNRPQTPREVALWAANVQADLASLLAGREKSKHRVITLSESFKNLSALSLNQDALLREALQCIEVALYRPAHVAAWAGFIDYLQEWTVSGTNLSTLLATRTRWNVQMAADLRQFTDYALIEALEACGLISKNAMKGLHGLLNKRNECAHPDDYSPGLNDTLGYVDELIKRLRALQNKGTGKPPP